MFTRFKHLIVFLPILLLMTFPSFSMQQPLSINAISNGVIDFYHVNYSIEFNITFTNLGASNINNFEIWVASIGNRTTGGLYSSTLQLAYLITVNPTPDKVLRDFNNPENQLLYFNTSIPAYSNYSIILRYNISSFEKIWLINPSLIGNYNTSSEIYLNYTKPEPFIQSDNPIIVTLANQLGDGLENPFTSCEKFYDWVSTNIQYQLQSEERGALWALENMRGDCSEFSDLFIALCRAYGIPARKVLGWAFSDLVGNLFPGSHFYVDYPGHAWVEVYFERYGWVVFDPTWGNSGLYYFSRVDPFHLAAIIGETISTTDFNTTELSFMAYRVAGFPDISYNFTIILEIEAVSSFASSYSFSSLFIIIVGLTGILLIIGVISKYSLKMVLKSV